MSSLSSQTEAPPRSEHPRPDFRREPWINLNGRWRFAFDPKDVGEHQHWYRLPYAAASGPRTSSDVRGVGLSMHGTFNQEIVVPFPWQSRLSGLAAVDYAGVAWYQRSLTVPLEWADGDAAVVRWRLRPALCFGAVDWNAKVWINGRFVGEHTGGYTPFAFDLADHIRPGQPATLTVRAHDVAAADTLIGKQVERWYTQTGGIWQTVWLEGRPAAAIEQIQISPDLPTGTATFSTTIAAADGANGDYQLRIVSAEGSFPEVAQDISVHAGAPSTLAVRVPQPHAWSPEDPHLYECTVYLEPKNGGERDAIRTYFGLRSVSTGYWEERAYQYVLLNGEPVYLRGALDQAFHPDGIYSYPSDDAIRADIQAAKDKGLNLLRCHIKINDPRYYYWADRLGMLIMYDIPNFDLYTPAARANWEQTLRAAIARDDSHPSIIAWIIFNETWGLEEHDRPESWSWVASMVALTKALDPSRLVEDNSTNKYDHVVTDLNSWHFYIDEYGRARRHIQQVVDQTFAGGTFNYVSGRHSQTPEAGTYVQGTQPLLNSEYAGIGARSGDLDVSYSFKFLTSELRRHDKICGYVYTELTDVEWEHNGYLNYDRSEKEWGYDAFVPGMCLADLNGADVVGLDCPPCQTLPPGSVFSAPAFVSQWDRRPLPDAAVTWQVTALDRFAQRRVITAGERRLTPRHYGVSDAGLITLTMPNEICLVTLALTLTDGAGNVRARNYVNLDVSDAAMPTVLERTAQGYTLSFLPEHYADTGWNIPILGRGDEKFGGTGAGWVEYILTAPDDLELARVSRLRLLFEAGARTARGRTGWWDDRYVKPTDYPQTEERQRPTDLRVTLNGLPLGETTLPDDPADARGVLSLHLQPHWEFGSYGFLTTLEATDDQARAMLQAGEHGALRVRFEVPATGRRGGLNLYGARMGAYPLRPTLLVDVAPEPNRRQGQRRR